MDDLVQHEQHSHRDSIDALNRFRGSLCLHGSLESEDNLCRNVAHAAPHRPYKLIICGQPDASCALQNFSRDYQRQ